jgi:hypothetical protein
MADMTGRRPTLVPVAALAAALLACPAAQAAAPPAAAAPAPDSERLARGLRLAQIVQPRELAVEQSMRTLDKQAVEGLLADPDLKQMEAEYPGIVPAMWQATRPIIAEALADTLPDLWNGLARVYAKHLTSAQIDETARFFQSPTGRKFVVEMNRNVDSKPMIRDAVRQGQGRIGEKSYVDTVSGAATAAASAMSPAELAEFGRFFESPTGKVLLGVGPDVTKVILEWSNREDPKVDARVEAAMIKVIEKFMGDGNAPSNGRPEA